MIAAGISAILDAKGDVMAGTRRQEPHAYSREEKIALVTEIDRRYRVGEGSRVAIARKLGTSDTNYYNWRKAGIEPVPARDEVPRTYDRAEREDLVAEVDRRRGNGQTVLDACRGAGITKDRYRRWKADLTPSSPLRPVEVTALVALPGLSVRPAQVVETLTLHAPGGYRIEGLAIESAAALLRALA